MADVELAFYNILANDATVAGLVSTRIYPLVIPQDAALPAIAYQRITAAPEYAQDGEAGLTLARMQVSYQAATYAAAKAVARAGRDALSAYRGTAATVPVEGIFLQSEYDGYEDVNKQTVVRQDYAVSFQE